MGTPLEGPDENFNIPQDLEGEGDCHAGVTRRVFLKAAVATGVVAGAASHAWTAEAKADVSYRTLGRTGEKISAIGLGGYHIGNPKDEAEAIRIVRGAIDGGINFMDNCWDYHDGMSEIR